MLARLKKVVFLQRNSQAEIAQLVEHDLAKVGVAGSSPVFRSNEEYQLCRTVVLHYFSKTY